MARRCVPLLDLKPQYETIKDEIQTVVQDVMESQHFILGPEVEAFEQEIAEYCGTEHCVGVSSGSDALLISMHALDIGIDDEVITSPYTFFATAGCISRVGARPVFVDIDPVTYNLDASQIAEKITSRTKAILPVHLYGQCADMKPILEVARENQLPVIEDAAQSLGAEYQGRRAGSLGTIGCFSFFPSKNLGAFGDGGAVTTNDAQLAERLRCMRMHGMEPKYYHRMIGGNFRLDALQAAVLRVKLKHLDSWTLARQQNAQRYAELFRDAGLDDAQLRLPAVVEDRHVFNQFIVGCADRDHLMTHLRKNDIGCEVYYPVPLHLQECYTELGYRKGDFPHTEAAALSTLALPIFGELEDADLRYVVETIADYYQSAGKLTVRKAA
jgi:dTDP-4-amino-4,6-dideoxygalactose transaminase